MIALMACGFTPLYQTSYDNNGQIVIAQLDGRTGHFLRKSLLNRLNHLIPEGQTGHLAIELKETIGRLALETNESASQTDVVTRADFRLALGAHSFTGQVEVRTAFIVPRSSFGDIAAQIESSRKSADLLAERITEALAIQLRAH